jgi:hypothetical protein
MGSRQVCNFAFPPQVTRPRPQNKEDVELEAQADKEIIDSAPDLSTDAPESLEEFPEIPEDGDQDEIAAEKEEALIDAQELQEGGEEEEVLPIKQQGGVVVDCTDDEKFLENTANGDCLFDSIAQVYYPIDSRDKEKDFSIVSKTSAMLRKGLSKIYLKANTNEEFRKEYSIPKEITGISKKTMSLADYSKFIGRPTAWGSDTDLEILSRILEVPFKLIEHNPDDEETKRSVRVIEKFNSSPSEEDYYTICNLDDRHFVLGKHEDSHVDNINEIFQKILVKR